jgi:alkylhydroperoxidase family enzyme
MARIRYAEPQDLPPEYRHLLPAPRNISRALANSPKLGGLARGLANYFQEDSRLDPRLRELAIIQVGYSTRSRYEYAHHVAIGLKVGVSEDDIRGVAEESAGRPTALDPVAKAVLRAAREMTLDIAMSERTFAELRPAFDDGQLVDLVYGIGLYNAVVRILASFEIDLEPAYETYLERFPLPNA